MKNEYEIRGDVSVIFVMRKGRKIECLIDTDQLEKINSFSGTWCAVKDSKSELIYVRGDHVRNGCRKVIPLHRFIMQTPKELVVDHINHDPLDNRKINLRNVTRKQNAQNRKDQRNNTSGARGVSWHKASKKWRVQISEDGRRTHVGSYSQFDLAANSSKIARKIRAT